MKKYFTEFEIRRMNIQRNDCVRNDKANKTVKMIIGGFIIVRILIMEIIYKKMFLPEKKRKLSYTIEQLIN